MSTGILHQSQLQFFVLGLQLRAAEVHRAKRLYRKKVTVTFVQDFPEKKSSEVTVTCYFFALSASLRRYIELTVAGGNGFFG
jgi:hypothetical protein